ncbi:MAG: hypothetical protein PHI12_08695 [Dehalococcoidales bacterium]|nr:hypothetical protein [Dehalococcoidales bacterium]
MNYKTDYAQKLKDPRWQKKRLEILARDEWTCQKCLDTESTLIVHHRLYISGNDPWDYPDDFLITLCETCHESESRNMATMEKGLIESLKASFFAEDIQELIVGFWQIELQYKSDIVASALGWAIRDPEMQREIVDKFVAQLKELQNALTGNRNA